MRRWGLAGTAFGLFAALWLAAVPDASAGPTTAAQARKLVAGWLNLEAAPLGTRLGPRVRRVETFRDDQRNPLYYVVYLKPAGFVVVPADDLVEPIVAFAPGGTYDPSPANPFGALVSRDVPGRIAAIRTPLGAAGAGEGGAGPAAPLRSAQEKWQRLTALADVGGQMGLPSVSDVRVAPLTASRWSQTNAGAYACYNYYTPPNAAGSTGNYPCGCVATAAAQLMRFHEHPTAGVGTPLFTISINGVSETRTLRGGNGAGGPYVWADMVLVPAGGTTLAQRQAIGALCYDAGVSVNMDYRSGGSGADTLQCATAFRTTFGYSNAVPAWNGGSTIPVASLSSMLNPNLDSGWPALLGIRGGSVGHAIVCDGYGYQSTTLYHHLNMGWAGSSDAWYNLPNINSSPSFTSVYKCIYNVFVTGTGEIISGRVVDGGGAPIEGASISGTRSGGGTYMATTNARGIYALPKVPSASSYTLTASKAGYIFTPLNPSTGTSSDYASTSGNVWGANFTGSLAPPDPPTGVAASDGTHAAKVAIVWNASAGATAYEVWRNTTDNSAAAVQIAASVTSASYDDATAERSVEYWFWVKAKSANGASGFSASDSGFAAAWYLVGDVYPCSGDEAGSFGDGVIDNADVIRVFWWSLGIPIDMPAAGTDRWDAADAYLQDNPPEAGGDQSLDNADVVKLSYDSLIPGRPLCERCRLGAARMSRLWEAAPGSPAIPLRLPDPSPSAGAAR